MKLLEKAKTTSADKDLYPADEEMIEVALAWVHGEVSLRQIAFALSDGKAKKINGFKYTVYARIASALRQYIRDKKL